MTLRRHLILPILVMWGCSSPRQDVPAPDGDEPCASPPTAQSSRIEKRGRTNREESERVRVELSDPDRISVITCGTGSPLPSGRAQSCTAVFAGGQMLVFDAGDGAQASMERLKLPVQEVSAVFITHFHSDHIADLGEVISRSWLLGRSTELVVHGPEGVDRVVAGFNQAYAFDEAHRIDHHGQDVMKPDRLAATARPFPDPGPSGAVVYEQGGVVVRAFRVGHAPVTPAVGYRVEHRGRAVGISGDTIDGPGLRALANGADILVAEVMDKHFQMDSSCAMQRVGNDRAATILRDILDYHIDSLELAKLSADVNVGTLMLTHQVPALSPDQARVYFTGPMQRSYKGELIVSEDGTRKVIDL